jgi:glycosyltransferase involved in cell wall biosynthesis
MRVTLHDYATDPALPQKDGVNLAHENIAALLRRDAGPGLEVEFHDFTRLLADEAYAREVLGRADCVVSNVGPHAHHYFWLRERLGLGFRIVRDVRTAIWSSYLLQEHLARPLLREEDLLLVASNYTRGVYEKIFPHLSGTRIARCYPLAVGFPSLADRRRRRTRGAGEALVIGYVGRLSEDKNFPDLVELLIRLNRAQPGRHRLEACGDVHSASCDPAEVRRRIARELGDDRCFDYLPARDNRRIWELYDRFDVLVFPSTSNLETLGRVLVEASHAGVPIVCGDHAAASELVPESALCRVDYARGTTFSAHFDHSLGRVSIDDMAAVLTRGPLEPARCHLDYATHPDRFLRLLVAGGGVEFEPFRLTPGQSAFIDALEVRMPPACGREEALATIAGLVPWFVELQARGTQARARRLDALLAMSRHPERTRRFVAKTVATRADFTDVGGIDIELCHVAGFYPSFALRAGGRAAAAGRSRDGEEVPVP